MPPFFKRSPWRRRCHSLRGPPWVVLDFTDVFVAPFLRGKPADTTSLLCLCTLLNDYSLLCPPHVDQDWTVDPMIGFFFYETAFWKCVVFFSHHSASGNVFLCLFFLITLRSGIWKRVSIATAALGSMNSEAGVGLVSLEELQSMMIGSISIITNLHRCKLDGNNLFHSSCPSEGLYVL